MCRKKNGHKGPRPGQTKEGSGASTWNSSPHYIPKNTNGINVSVSGLRYARMSNVEGFYTNQGYRPVSRDWVETKVLGLERNCFQAHIRKPH